MGERKLLIEVVPIEKFICAKWKMYLSKSKIVFVKNDLLCVPSDLYT